MIKRIFFILFLCGNIFLSITIAKASDNNVYIQTDRFCYVSGDIAFFKVYIPEYVNTKREQAICIDLISCEGTFICGELVKLTNGMASGYFEIPDTLPTGSYDIRAYMGQSIDSIEPVRSIKHVFVSNRFGKEGVVWKDLINDEILNSSIRKTINNPNCEIQVNKKLFHTREKVTLSITFNSSIQSDTLFASLSIKPVSNFEKRVGAANANISGLDDNSGNNRGVEIGKGVKVSGRLLNPDLNIPIKKAVVFLSFQDTVLRLQYALSDDQGYFCFYTDGYYDRQLVIFSACNYPSLKPLEKVKFEIHSSFIEKGSVNKGAYQPSLWLIDTLNISKALVSKAYNINYVKKKTIPLRDTFMYCHKFFTGKLTDQVNPDDYLTFFDFTELSREILPFVRYRKTDDGYKFSIVDQINNFYRDDPFVIVDGVPLFDLSKINQLGTEQLKRIDVKGQPRFYGDIFMSNGIVLIWTKNADFWSQIETGPMHKEELQFFQKPAIFCFPDYSIHSDTYIPDFRQTLFWKPEIIVPNNNKIEIEFYTSDEKGNFEIIMEGITSKGQQIYEYETFTVE
ncbi:MAG: hypothetical protein JXB49_20970 [Bacteroidales bacterium]|nr:hypothetical protein [Bacteroidales bacterium]